MLSALGSDVLDLDRRTALSFQPGAATVYGVWRTRRAVAAADVVFADSVRDRGRCRPAHPRHQHPNRPVRRGDRTGHADRAVANGASGCSVDEDDFVALSSRVIQPNYNIDTIIRAFAEIHDRIPGSVLVLKEYPPSSDVDYRRSLLRADR